MYTHTHAQPDISVRTSRNFLHQIIHFTCSAFYFSSVVVCVLVDMRLCLLFRLQYCFSTYRACYVMYNTCMDFRLLVAVQSYRNGIIPPIYRVRVFCFTQAHSTYRNEYLLSCIAMHFSVFLFFYFPRFPAISSVFIVVVLPFSPSSYYCHFLSYFVFFYTHTIGPVLSNLPILHGIISCYSSFYFITLRAQFLLVLVDSAIFSTFLFLSFACFCIHPPLSTFQTDKTLFPFI